MNRVLAMLLLGLALSAQGLNIYTELSPPNQYQDAEGRLTGFVVELVRELQRRTGSADRIQLVPWVRAYRELETMPNVVLFSVARSAKRDPLFQWVGPVGESSFVFFIRKGSGVTIGSLDEARALRLIGVYREDARDQYLSRLGFTNLDRSIDQVVMIKKLMAGRIDAIVGSSQGMDAVAQEAGFEPGMLQESFSFQRVQTYIAFSRATPAPVVKAWKEALKAARKDGTFEALYRRFYPSLPLPGEALKPF